MTQFSSKPPFNDDPAPWADYWERSAEQWAPGDAYAPRPEYERPQHNPTNPILREIRAEILEFGFHAEKELIWLNREDLYWDHYPSGTRNHALRVLTRLANLAE